MARKGYSALHRSPKLNLHRQMQFSVILITTLFVGEKGVLPLSKGYNQGILYLAVWAERVKRSKDLEKMEKMKEIKRSKYQKEKWFEWNLFYSSVKLYIPWSFTITWLSVISRTLVRVGGLTSQQRCSRCILQVAADWALIFTGRTVNLLGSVATAVREDTYDSFHKMNKRF